MSFGRTVTNGGVTRLVSSFVALWLAAFSASGATYPYDDESANGPVRDNQLAVQGRLALAHDPTLSRLPLHVGVSVRDGVAALWGTVPSVVVGRQAEAVLRRVPGVLGVRGEYQVLPSDDPIAEFLRRSPPSSHAAPPAEWARNPQPGFLTARPGEWASAASPLLKPSLPDLPSVELQAPLPVTLGLPIPLPDPSPDSPTARPVPTLREAVDGLVRANPRYQGVECTVEAGVVRLRGFVNRGEDTYALAREISRLPGVERVLVDPVRTQPPARPPGAPAGP